MLRRLLDNGADHLCCLRPCLPVLSRCGVRPRGRAESATSAMSPSGAVTTTPITSTTTTTKCIFQVEAANQCQIHGSNSSTSF